MQTQGELRSCALKQALRLSALVSKAPDILSEDFNLTVRFAGQIV